MTANVKALAMWRYSVFRPLGTLLIKNTKFIVYSIVRRYSSAEAEAEQRTKS